MYKAEKDQVFQLQEQQIHHHFDILISSFLE